MKHYGATLKVKTTLIKTVCILAENNDEAKRKAAAPNEWDDVIDVDEPYRPTSIDVVEIYNMDEEE